MAVRSPLDGIAAMSTVAQSPERVPTGLQRAAMVVFCVVAGLLVVWSGLDRLSRQRPDLARFVPGAFAANAYRASAGELARRGDYAAAEREARKAVASSPLVPLSTALLGTARLGKYDLEGAERAFLVSGQLGWRTAVTQLYWFERALELGDYRVAALRLDALLRQSPGLAGDDRLIAMLERSPEGREALAGRMTDSAVWLQRYARDIHALDPDRIAVRADVLNRRKGALGCVDSGPLATALVATGQVGAAHAFWMKQCPRSSRGLLADAGFSGLRTQQANSPFEWIVFSHGDVSASLRGGSGTESPRLVITSSASFVRKVIQQMVVLPPGAYRLSWSARNELGELHPNILASASCSADSREWLPAEAAGDRFQADFTVDGRCPGLWVAFAIAPGRETISFGDLRLVRLD